MSGTGRTPMESVKALASRVPRAAWILLTALVLAAAVLAVVFAAGGSDPAPAQPQATASAASPAPASSPSAGEACAVTAAVTDSWPGGYRVDLAVVAGADLTGWEVGVDLGTGAVDAAWGVSVEAGATGAVTGTGASALEAGARADAGLTVSGDAPESLTATCEGTPTATPTPEPSKAVPTPVAGTADRAPNDDDWLRTDGNRIVDLDGNEVRLTGANWFGFNTSERVLHGLWSVDMGPVLDQVAQRGLNVLRVPISTELLLEWRAGEAEVSGSVNQAGAQAGLTTLEVFDAFLEGCRERGIKVILDMHSALADNAGHMAPMWFAGDVTAEDYMTAWEWVAERYRDDDTILAFDLENEPHGQPQEDPRAKWDGSEDADNWRHVAQQVAARILAIHPDVLILVEGVESTPRDGATYASTDPADFDITWWGGNLRGAAEHPIDLGAYQDRLVYSPHDYGPLVYEQPWFAGDFSRESLVEDVWGPNWLYLHDDGTAPLLLGEWGGRLGQDQRQDRWMTALRDLIVDEGLSHTFWCLNPNSADTGGLLLDDWTSWDETKYALLEPALWQDDAGRFISLDHQVAWAGGVSVGEHYAG